MKYRVLRQQVRFQSGACHVEDHVYGPFRWKWIAILVAYLVCGAWDRCIVQEKS